MSSRLIDLSDSDITVVSWLDKIDMYDLWRRLMMSMVLPVIWYVWLTDMTYLTWLICAMIAVTVWLIDIELRCCWPYYDMCMTCIDMVCCWLCYYRVWLCMCMCCRCQMNAALARYGVAVVSDTVVWQFVAATPTSVRHGWLVSVSHLRVRSVYVWLYVVVYVK